MLPGAEHFSLQNKNTVSCPPSITDFQIKVHKKDYALVHILSLDKSCPFLFPKKHSYNKHHYDQRKMQNTKQRSLM